MLKVICGNNMKRESFMIAGTTIILPDGNQRTLAHDVTLRDIMDASGIDFSRGTSTLDGATLNPGDINKTFAALGYADGECRLLNVVKADNA